VPNSPTTRPAVVRRLLAAVCTGALVAAVPTAGSSPARAATSCSSSGLATHLVVEGDTWFDIARRAEVSMRSLFDVNDASADVTLHPGDEVCLPAGAVRATSCTPSNAPTYTVRSGDTWWDIATRVGVSMSRLLSINGAREEAVIHPGDDVCLPMGATIADGSAAGSAAAQSARAVSTSSSTGGSGLQALPMQGPCWFADSWGDPRGGGRVHQGVDLFAAPRSYVYAVVDGTLTRRAWDQPGRRSGNAWWLTAADGSGTYYFYAHLADFAPGLEVGSRVEAGEIIGFMGNTGNSAFPHLHFEIHPNGGGAVNPYPLMRELGGCKTGDGYRQPNGWVPD
jgi:murein DD-endopeptidase MepM/ murein hydrolase activator NlpD